MKLCLSIAPNYMQEAMAQLRKFSGDADLIEVRIDGIKDLDLEKLLKKPRPAVIITNRRRDEGGKFIGTSDEQIAILSSALQYGAEYVDIELRWGKKQLRKILSDRLKNRIIVSYHNFRQTPRNLRSIYHRICNTNASLIKIATMANEISDNKTIFNLLEEAARDRKKLIALAMGERGQISRILGKKFGSFLTYAAPDTRSFTAAGQLLLHDLKEIYRVHILNRQTKIFGLVGNPVAQSIGIYFHNCIFSEKSFNAVYVNFLVDNLKTFFDSFAELITGLSVTMPFKQTIIPFLDKLEGDVSSLRVVNTIIARKGKLIGHNTDLPAINRILKRRTNLRGKHVLILGTGATAKMMAFAARMNGASVTIIGRSPKKTQALASEMRCSWTDFTSPPVERADIVMNAIPDGVLSIVGTSLFPKNFFRKGMVVLDAAYNPPITQLLQIAQDAGCEAISGVELFYEQAKLQSKIFLESSA